MYIILTRKHIYFKGHANRFVTESFLEMNTKNNWEENKNISLHIFLFIRQSVVSSIIDIGQVRANNG